MHNISYKYIFGPVPSRRLGTSLGVDLMPHKTCSLNCVYCECGKTTHLTLKRKEYVPVSMVQQELKDFLSHKPKLDFITFSGSGEPTLHNGIGKIIHFLKSNYPQYKIALLTNGTLFYDSNVIKQILNADVVKVSLDAASEKNFININKPHPKLNLSKIIEGLILLRKQFSQQLWIEVFLVTGFNDNEAELKGIKKIINLINPDKIHINTLDRPGAEKWIKPVDKQTLLDAAEYLGEAEIIKRDASQQNDKIIETGNFNDILLSTLKRRPCTAEDISKILNISSDKTCKLIDALIQNGKIEISNATGIFFCKTK